MKDQPSFPCLRVAAMPGFTSHYAGRQTCWQLSLTFQRHCSDKIMPPRRSNIRQQKTPDPADCHVPGLIPLINRLSAPVRQSVQHQLPSVFCGAVILSAARLYCLTAGLQDAALSSLAGSRRRRIINRFSGWCGAAVLCFLQSTCLLK